MVIASSIIAIAVSVFMVYVGLNHNPMGDFCTNPGEPNCNINLIYTGALSWFTPTFTVSFVILLFCY